MSGKKLTDALKTLRPRPVLHADRGAGHRQDDGQGRLRRERRRRRAPRRRPAQGRPDGPRHRRPAGRHRQGRARRRVRRRRRRRRGARGRRRHRRRRRPRRPGRGGQVRLRRGHRHARHDAARRPPRPGPRAPRPDAEPEDRHRHHRRRPGRAREFKGGKVEYRTDRYGNVHVPLGKVSFEPSALETNFRAVLDELQRAKPAVGQGPLPAGRSPSRRRWAPASASTPTACAPTPSDPVLNAVDRRARAGTTLFRTRRRGRPARPSPRCGR